MWLVVIVPVEGMRSGWIVSLLEVELQHLLMCGMWERRLKHNTKVLPLNKLNNRVIIYGYWNDHVDRANYGDRMRGSGRAW